jgi:anionic cell wall polymer biosynthesis LytR-Cps2A-Psr (LCP) family protein
MSPTKRKRKKGSRTKSLAPWVIVSFLLIFAVWSLYSTFFGGAEDITFASKSATNDTTRNSDTRHNDSNFVKAVSYDSTDDYLTISEIGNNPEFDSYAGSPKTIRYTGRRINIAIVGLDSRLGALSNHADANHVVSILIDSGKIEIISVPRDTPADAGLHDSTGQNKLTVVRAVRGREFYLQELARIAQIDKIHYYIEVGFSQVIGLLDFFGFKDSKSTLQVLRSRKGLGGDDYQRCYNQAQFIRQMILKHYDEINNGFFADVLIRGGLALLTTNLNNNAVKFIIGKLNASGFPKSPNDITIKIRPPLPIKFKIYDLSNEDVINKLKTKIEHFNKQNNEIDSIKVNVFARLDRVTKSASQDTLKRPKRAIQILKPYYEQRAWLQIENQELREEIRTRFEKILISSYNRTKQFDNAKKVFETIQSERELFNLKNKK